ncbi:hypothetical protein DTL42_17920 [Bremerella cremea]|uniref:Uncharacterized protein n=1 Tax=Bremerella cremea TaxID=1031537 RepID=A0A368KMW8_9BACT|nr:hypothetical protein DTL42_17920 [Bremerella cremea]
MKADAVVRVSTDDVLFQIVANTIGIGTKQGVCHPISKMHTSLVADCRSPRLVGANVVTSDR